MGLERRVFLLVVFVAGLGGIVWLVATSGTPGRDSSAAGRATVPAREAEAENPPLPATPPSAAPLSGVVHTFAGEPAPGAEVRAILLGEDLWPRPDGPPAPRATAGPDGRFTFRELAPGAYLLDARAGDARGFVPAVRIGGEPVCCVIRLMESGAVSGRVVGEDGAPVAGAVVTADVGGVLRPYYEAMLGRFSSEALERIEARTDAAGVFRLSSLPAGLTDLEVRAERRETIVVPAVACPVDGIDVRLLDTIEVTGRAPKGDGLAIRTDPPCEVELTGGGRFILRGLVRGRYRIGGSAAGQAFTPGEFAVEAGRAPPELTLTATRRARVEGFVLDGSPEPVRVGRAEVAFFRVRTLDADPLSEDGGALRISAEPKGDYEVWLSPGIWYAEARRPGSRVPWLLGVEGRPPTSRLLAVGDKTTTRHDLTVLPERTVSGVVLRAPDDRPVAGARVLLSLHVGTVPEDRPPRPPDLRREAPTGANGSFSFEGLPPLGRMAFCVIDPRSGVILAEAATWAGGPETGRIVLRTGVEGTASVRGRMIDDQARPVPGAVVLIGGRPFEAGADGRFEAARLPAGTASVVAFALGYAPTRAVLVALPAEERLDLPDLVLSRAGVEVRGRIADEAGEPIPGARVRVDFGGAAVYETRTGPDGTWSQRGPATGEEGCHVTVSAVGYGRAGRQVRLEPLEEQADFALAALSPGITGRLFMPPRLGGVALLLAGQDGPPARPGSWSRVPAEFDGRDFTVRDVPAGRYRMRLVVGGFAVRDLGVQTVKAGETLDLGMLIAQPGGTIRGSVEPPAASESLLIGIAILDLWTPVAADGSFLLDGIPPGTFDLRTWSGKHYGNSLPVTVRSGEETEVLFRR